MGVGALLLSFDHRWSAWRLLVQTFSVASAFLVVGAIRAWGDFDHADPMTWLYLGGLVGIDAALVLLSRAMQAQPRAGR